MDFSTILQFIKANPKFIISVCLGVAFFVVNIIQAIRSKSISKLKEALLKLPEVISAVESTIESSEWSFGPWKGQIKKELVSEKLNDLYGRLYLKNKQVFDDAIEDILSTPQKKGGQVDVSQKNEEK